MEKLAVKKRKHKISRITLKEQRAAYVFLIPAFLGLSLITYLPLLAVFGISLFDFKMGHFVANSTIAPAKFVGFQNFIDIFTNPRLAFFESIKVTVYYALVAVIGSVIYSMIIAMLLNRKMPGRGFLRAIFYVPYILPTAAIFVGWIFLYRYDGGLFNHILVSAGLSKSYFLDSAKSVVPSLALMAVWASGNLVVIFLAGLQNVPRVYQEAAEIDGANAWQRFWKVTIPNMTPIIFYNVLMSLVMNLQVVVPALAYTKGGPGNSSMFLTFLMYRTAFTDNDYSRASAMAFMFFIVAAILAFILFATSKNWIFYEGGDDK